MKKYFLITFLILSLNTIVAQQYYSFPKLNAMWRESSGGFQCSCCSDYQYYIGGDTIISATTYHKIQHSGANYWEDGVGNCTTIITGYFDIYKGAFREDSINKKIYFVEPTSSSDTLLYSFNLNIGDTLPNTYMNASAPRRNWVSKIDSVLVGGFYHKRFSISWGDTTAASVNVNYVSIIEGVGSTFGLFGKLAPPFESGSTLLCFSTNDSTQYPNGGAYCPAMVQGIKEIKNILDINVYPNPANNKLSIEFENGTPQNTLIEIRNVLGEVLYSERLKGISGKQLKTIDLSLLPDDIYFINLQNDNESVSKKFIRQ
jgi:hypothetical protein